MLGGEGVTGVGGRELLAGVEGHLERGEVGLEEDVRDDDLVLQFRMLAGVTRILMAADVVPGPAIKTILLDAGDVVGDEVVAEAVALVGGAPELAGGGVD